ncbi:MAG TPA: helix-hairpin-helix domain-containing protein [Actinomycetota bacterium]|nr:helix-hairpin-helix domain-containing protein [Actinomycetota bacterium]
MGPDTIRRCDTERGSVDRGLNGGLREWLAGLGRRELAVLAAVGVLVGGGAVLWYVRSLPRPVTVRTLRPEPAPSPSPVPVVVHVAGWVRRPGVYELGQGERVIDALEAAGGPRRGADLDALNLAAVLLDGQQVMIPRKSVGGGAGAGPSPSGGSTGVQSLINLNSATAEELETLPGIGPVLANTIIEYRESNGPFTTVDDLLEVSGIGDGRLADIRDLVTV